MVNFLLSLIPLELWVALLGLVSSVFALVLGRNQGKMKERQKQKMEQMEADNAAREKIDAALDDGGSADDARIWLRDRQDK